MRKKTTAIGLFGILAFIFSINVYSQELSFNGYVRNTTGLLLDKDPLDYSTIQNTFDLKADYTGDISDLHAEGYVYLDKDSKVTSGVRELYLDMFFNSVDFRIGKQQIIWGKADGVFITDVVSPKDMSSFIIPDFDEIRLGVTSVKVDWYVGDFTLEGVWIPVFTPNKLPSSDSIWALSMDFPTGVKPSITTTLPDKTFENSEGFAKISYMGGSLDLDLMGGYMFDDSPAGHVTSFNPMTTPKTVNISREYQRLLMGGGSFSTELAGFVLRGEGAYYKGKIFNLSPDALFADLGSGGDGTREKDYIHYMAGIDYVLAGVNVSAQFIQEYILDYDDSIGKDEFTNTLTFLAAKKFLNDTLEMKFLGYYGLTNEDVLLRFSAGYEVTDGMQVVLGSDIFIGDSGYFGQYDSNDMVYAKVKYSF